jgi:hypothetical protein
MKKVHDASMRSLYADEDVDDLTATDQIDEDDEELEQKEYTYQQSPIQISTKKKNKTRKQETGRKTNEKSS